MNTGLSMGQILSQFLPAYRAHHRLSPQQANVTNLIGCCRTQVLGGQRVHCEHCEYETEYYHSCRNRHCPQCQQHATDQWLARRREDLLPVPYFHLVFTLPHTLNGWAQLHPDVVYGLLFKSVWHTLQRFGRDPKRLDGELGMTAVLHTWGQTLGQHIHLHCLIPGGALAEGGRQWHRARSTYLFPVKALSRHYRGTMVSELRQAVTDGRLHRVAESSVGDVLKGLMSTPWVVFGRSTCTHQETVLKYLAQYTHRIAISNYRLRAVEDDAVVFSYKDYASGGRQKVMHLEGVEFIRRYLMHVLPPGFMRIRHYGEHRNVWGTLD